MKRVAAIFVPLVALALAVFAPHPAHADSLLRVCTATGNCGVCDIAATAVTIGKWLITASAALALVVIVWASTVFATSAGNAEKIGEAKKQILGAVFGVGIVFAAFYLVFWVILAFANPSQQFRFSEAPDAGDKVAKSTGLVDFLGGTAWWNLCNEKDLLASGDAQGAVTNKTADCKFWGDGTPCTGDRKSICFGGACVPVGDSAVQAKIAALNGFPLPASPSACDYLASVDMVFKDYICSGIDACNPEKTETGFCGGTTVCCEPKIFTPRVRPAAGVPAVAAPPAPAPTGDEATVRAALGNVGINKAPCQDINTSTDCTSVAGLSQSTINKLIDADNRCGGCVIITGGTERGPHAKNTTHGSPNVVDIGNSSAAQTALDQMGLERVTSFTTGYAKGSNWYICDTGGQAVSCSSASHLHIEF